jgi:hypothetical protein
MIGEVPSAGQIGGYVGIQHDGLDVGVGTT